MSIITLAHGSGGLEYRELLEKILFPKVKLKATPGGRGLDFEEDSAIIRLDSNRLIAVTSDSYTVKPIFFPGGDIGKLAACGTINDLAVMGAKPLAFLDTIVVREGFRIRDLERIFKSMITVLEKYSISLIGGDLKVMPKGSLEDIIITTMGIGVVERGKLITNDGLKPGDVLIINGGVGEHGAVILAMQLGIDVGRLKSDCSSILDVVELASKYCKIHAAKDPTRGGLAMALNELAEKSKVGIIVYEDRIPVREEVEAICEMAGIDPLALACEGRVILGVPREYAENIVEELRGKGYKDASIIGEVTRENPGRVILETSIGSHRLILPPTGELVPRIC